MARRRRTTSETEGTGTARPRLGTLKMLTPYVARHRGRLVLAASALTVAAAATLTIPLAVRRMIDLGFGADDASFIDRYFGMLVVIVGVLALASAARYYLVTWLGERVVADLRADVFAHVARLDAGFFDRTHSGEIVSRLTADATQIKSAVGTTIFSALRNFVLCVGAIAMMVVTSPSLSLLVIVAIPVIVLPLYGFARTVRRRSRLAQDLIAEASSDATEAIGAMRALQAFRGETDATVRYRRRLEAAFEALRGATVARAALTAVGVFLVFSSVVAVLWMGATDVLTGKMSAGTLGQFVLYAVFAAGDARRAVAGRRRARPDRRRRRAARRTARDRSGRRRPARAAGAAAAAAGPPRLRGGGVLLPDRRRPDPAPHRPCGRTRRDGGDRRPVRRRQVDAVRAGPALLRPGGRTRAA